MFMMQKLKLIAVGVFLVGLAGCSGYGDTQSKVAIGDQFQVNDISLTVSQKITSAITYHTASELQSVLTDKVKKRLAQQGLLTTRPSANALMIQVVYKRKFLDENTTLPSDSLDYPHYDFEIKVMNGVKELTRISRKELIFKGRFIMRIDTLAGRLNKKSDEIVFIDGLAKEIVRSVQILKN